MEHFCQSQLEMDCWAQGVSPLALVVVVSLLKRSPVPGIDIVVVDPAPVLPSALVVVVFVVTRSPVVGFNTVVADTAPVSPLALVVVAFVVKRSPVVGFFPVVVPPLVVVKRSRC